MLTTAKRVELKRRALRRESLSMLLKLSGIALLTFTVLLLCGAK